MFAVLSILPLVICIQTGQVGKVRLPGIDLLNSVKVPASRHDGDQASQACNEVGDFGREVTRDGA
jgi:hypothetical protein